MTDEEVEARMAPVRKLLAEFDSAIATKDWTRARLLWTVFEPFYPELFAANPDLAHVETLLTQNEAFARPSVGGVH